MCLSDFNFTRTRLFGMTENKGKIIKFYEYTTINEKLNFYPVSYLRGSVDKFFTPVCYTETKGIIKYCQAAHDS